MGVAMIADNIIQISIDNSGRLCIFPATQKFVLIYRSATEVHWDNQQCCLYSPKPREWNYHDWFTHITKVIRDECSCELLITAETVWLNIPEKLKQQIIRQSK